MKKKLGFIGAGKMGGAIIKGIIASGLCKRENITASEINEEFAKKTSQELGIKVITDNNALVKDADVIFLCTKPFILKDVLTSLKNSLTEDKIIISIAAGISTQTIESVAEKNIPTIRSMPNTPALVNEGMTAVCKGQFATDEHIKIAKEIFSQVSKCVEIEENLIDAVTGVSGSGPAFMYHIIDIFAKGGEKQGLQKDIALELAAQTALGAAKMILETGKSPSVLKDEVTTPGGTTAEGRAVLENSDIEEIFAKTVKNTTKKSAKLG